jgi:hypothetical protein
MGKYLSVIFMVIAVLIPGCLPSASTSVPTNAVLTPTKPALTARLEPSLQSRRQQSQPQR